MDALRKLFGGRGSSPRKPVKYSLQDTVAHSGVAGAVTDKNDPHTEIWKPQRSTGDQEDSSRIPFYNSGFSACVKCGRQNVMCFEEKAGVRSNGDVFGTKIFLCQTPGCKWRTSFKYDDADPMCIHFETKGWPRGINMFPPRFMVLWCRLHGMKELRRTIHKRKLDGDEILAMYKNDELEIGLGINKKMANKMKKAIEKPDGAVLLHR